MKMEDSHMKEMSILILMFENIFGDEDGNLYALGNGGPLVRWVQKRMKRCLITA